LKTSEFLVLLRCGIAIDIQRLTAPRLLFGFATGLIVLTSYCLGHSLFNNQTPDVILSLRWSLVHACGVTLLISISYALRQRHWTARAGLSLTIAVLGVSAVAWVMGISSASGYTLLTSYLILSLLIAVLLTPVIERTWLEIDFGRSRKLVPTHKLLAVHGARNYLEVEVEGYDSPGLLRLTLEEILRRNPDRLVRVHRSHLVNPTAVRELEARPRGGLTLILKNGSEVPVSPRYVDPVMARLTAVPGAAFSSQSPSRQ
jgi:hypothetical protein